MVEVSVIAAPIACEEAHIDAHLVGPEEEVESKLAAPEGDAGPELAGLEEADNDCFAGRADGIEGAPDDARRGNGQAAESSGPEFDSAGVKFFAGEFEEGEGLGGEVVAAAGAGAEAFHDGVEGACVEEEGPACVVPGGEGFGGEGPIALGVVEAEASYVGVDELSELAAGVDGDDAAARSGGALLGVFGSPRAKEGDEADPVGGGEAFEADIGGEHGGGLVRLPSGWYGDVWGWSEARARSGWSGRSRRIELFGAPASEGVVGRMNPKKDHGFIYSGSLPFSAGNSGLPQHHREQTYTDVSSVRIRDRQHRIVSDHEFVSTSRMGTVESKAP